MIIDVHAHTSNSRMLGLHTNSATITDLENYAKRFQVVKIILMATYFPFKGTGLFNQILLDRIKGNNLFGCFLSLDAMNALQDGVDEIFKLVSHPQVLGIKLYPGYQDFSVMNHRLFPLYEIAQERKIPIAVHTGELHHCCPQQTRFERMKTRCKGVCKIDALAHLAHPTNFTEVSKKFPEVKFILSHLSNPYFQKLRELMKLTPNVYTDISGSFVSGTDEDCPKYRELLKEELIKFLKVPNGINRILFGTDFPIQSYQHSIEIVDSLNLSEKEKERIYFRNAQELLKL